MVRGVLLASTISVGSGATWFNASTTQFEIADYSTQTGSCGGCSLNMFAGIDGWAAVAAAESMQTPFACDGNFACATGQDQVQASGPSGQCGQCYSVRSQGLNPYDVKIPKVEFKAAVVDTCAHTSNKDWCAKHVGVQNKFGFEYHLNILDADAKKLHLGDNPIVQFLPIDCPEEILTAMQSNCCDKWFKGVGCNTICPDNQCSAPTPAPTPTPAPQPSPTGKCDPPCTESRTCATQADGFWSQCIDCTPKIFQKECVFWKDDLRAAAEATCSSNCSAVVV